MSWYFLCKRFRCFLSFSTRLYKHCSYVSLSVNVIVIYIWMIFPNNLAFVGNYISSNIICDFIIFYWKLYFNAVGCFWIIFDIILFYVLCKSLKKCLLLHLVDCETQLRKLTLQMDVFTLQKYKRRHDPNKKRPLRAVRISCYKTK